MYFNDLKIGYYLNRKYNYSHEMHIIWLNSIDSHSSENVLV